MPPSLLWIAALALCFLSYLLTKKKLTVLISDNSRNIKTNSLPGYYGLTAAAWVFITAFSAYIIATILLPKNLNYSFWIKLALMMAAGTVALNLVAKKITPEFHARKHIEKIINVLLIVATCLSIAVTLAIVFSVLIEAIKFFRHVSVFDFLFGLKWSPQTALRADQGGSSGAFGAVPVFLGTLMITLIAMLVAIPCGLFSAIFISEYASGRTRNIVKPVLEILAGIPTVVYGYFAAVSFAPALRSFGETMGFSIASESAFSAGFVMGIMIIPFIMSLSDDVMNAVPQSLRDGSLALGATRSETIKKVIIPAALPGIMGAVLLAVSRGIGETMIVVMAAGLAANLTLNPFASVTTVTAQIVSLLTGDQEFDSPKTLAAFALGLTLFIMTLALNVIAISIVKKYREQYE